MSTRGEVVERAADAFGARGHSPARLPLVVHVLAVGAFLMLTTEFVVAGLLPEIAGDLRVSVPEAGLLITVFAAGMIIGAPSMAMLTLRLPRRLTLMLALGVFAAGHLVVAVGSSFALLLAARFVTALATGGVLGGGQRDRQPHRGPWGKLPSFGPGERRRHARQRRRGASRRVRRATGGLARPVLGAGDPRGGGCRSDRPHRPARWRRSPGTTVLLPTICLLSGQAWAMVVLVVLLGFFGLGANPVLISMSVRFAGQAPTLASALSVSAFNFGTAVGTWIAGRALDSSLETTGPAVVGTAIAALTLIPTITIALTQRRRVAAPVH
ncbi:MFS transporter [Microbispora siamensis]|uniref:Major facilitator superfamily (MFS) profile domain-containing protein n=1 Tax=Microbispora siamensis TaxID=564413 RepID=A0ABQ4GKJ3_9ACTN|nr:hypothetical protein Msi02_27560 [Microbispora siamensis]